VVPVTEDNKPRLTFGGATHPGLARAENEDAWAVWQADDGSRFLAVVADGMGGAVAGEQASRLAVEVVVDAFREGAVGKAAADILRRVFKDANDAVYKAGAADPPTGRRGSTCTALVVDGGRYVVGHVGDSRAYLRRDGELNRITEDHSLVAEAVGRGLMTAEEAAQSDQRHVITRALGARADVAADFYEGEVAPGDGFLLCTDGLTNELGDDEIATIIAAGDAEAAVGRLVAAANERGGRDNVTVIIVVVGEA
jgi:serine/threonine protein phosphatase PrpC